MRYYSQSLKNRANKGNFSEIMPEERIETKVISKTIEESGIIVSPFQYDVMP